MGRVPAGRVDRGGQHRDRERSGGRDGEGLHRPRDATRPQAQRSALGSGVEGASSPVHPGRGW